MTCYHVSKPVNIACHRDIEPHDLAEVSVEILPRVKGRLVIHASLHSRELTSVYGERIVDVGNTHIGVTH